MHYKINSANESIIDAIVSGFFKHGGKIHEAPDVYMENGKPSPEEKADIYNEVDEWLYKNRYGISDLVKKKYPSIKFSIDDFVFTTYREYSYYTRRTNAHKAAYITGIYMDSSNNVYTIRMDIKVKSGAAKLSKQNIDDCLLEFKMWPMRDIIDKSI